MLIHEFGIEIIIIEQDIAFANNNNIALYREHIALQQWRNQGGTPPTQGNYLLGKFFLGEFLLLALSS